MLPTSSFNSLQTGTAFRTYPFCSHKRIRPKRFNSLQTGKAFRTGHDFPDMHIIYVFQFPSNGKGFPNLTFQGTAHPYELMFQFPSNGKGFPNRKDKFAKLLRSAKVSIPFKRERLSELEIRKIDKDDDWNEVSIPFKRERLSER